MFVCRCGRTCEDHETRVVLENPLDSNSRLVRVCDVCAQRQSNVSCGATIVLLVFIVVIILAFFQFCRP
jgi:hypothetical protein